jgi:hypothetical protein
VFCTCTSLKNVTYTNYQNTIDFVYPADSLLPAIEITVKNGNYYALYNTGFIKNIVNKKFLDGLGIETANNETEITIPQIILSNGLILNNVTCEISGFNDDDDVILMAFGLSALNEYNVVVSYKQEKIFLYDRNVLPENLDSWVLVERVYPEGDKLYIHGYVEGSRKEYLFFLSTGITLYWGIYDRHYNMGLDRRIPVSLLWGNRNTVIIGGKKYRNLYFNNSLTERDKESLNLGDEPIDIILGYDFFTKYDIFIGNNNGKIYLERP